MTDIRDAVFNAIKCERDAEPPREYLGASSIGRECAKEIWYSFRHGDPKDQFNGRMYRLFEHGDQEEDRIVRDLRRAGFKVIDKKPNGEQYGFEALDGMFRGHIDGVIIIDGEPHLLECKTAGEKPFEQVQKEGVFKAKPEHYAQMQVYMHYVEGKTKLRKALYFVVNKNNDDIYTEIVDYHEGDAEHYIEKAKSIIDTTHDASASPGWKCGFCSFRNMCASHKKSRDESIPGVPVSRISCRNCVHAKLDQGTWSCKLTGNELDFTAQLEACKKHVFLPDFVSFAEAIEWDETRNGIRYKHEDGHEFVQGPNDITSDAMAFYPKALIQQDNAEMMLKRAFGCEVVGREDAPF